MAASMDSELKHDVVSGKIKDIFCQPCLHLNKQSMAKTFCTICDEFQCTICLKVHLRFAYMRGHKFVNAKEVKIKQVSFDMKESGRCNHHQKLIEFFCEDESQLCCSTCAIVDHRTCSSVIDVQKAAEKSASKCSSLKVKFQEVKQKAEIIISNVAFSKEKHDKDVKEIPVKIRQMRDKVLKLFDALEVSVVKNAESFQTETLEKLTKKRSRNEKYLSDIQSRLDTIDNVYENGTSVQQFIVEQKMKQELNIIHSTVDAECKDLETTTVSFDFDETLKLPPLPIIDYVPGKLDYKFCISEAASKICSDVPAIKLTPEITIDLKQSEDDKVESLYSGIDVLPDGRLVAVDNLNMKCLVYNEKLEKVGSYQLSYRPLSVVAVSGQEVAITSSKEYKFDILRVDKSNHIALDR